ncbi:PHP domain-containing protein [Thiomicrorhabdus sp. zzn3]|uniref:PHP domain-containing protein n=1 Tax=Thiomicrorhabdus sp. zzn3 TaxID=3039775 RepID=UPI0024370A7D|nr:PHP domain-containing protein [Thiomicrorhabdus sp. zzn3]MDG6778033.1 PHP domain-containing protein [Thiomicrorhabdus sp. zzn3]
MTSTPKVDFHCHTTASDGALSPQQLIELAHTHQITHLAITDHDTTAGYQQALKHAQQKGIRLTSGVEISCEWQKQTIHIVGLDFDATHPKLQQGLADIRALRWKRANEIIEKLSARPNLAKLDIKTRLMEQVGEGVVGRGHFAQLLIESGYVKNTQQAFDKYLKKGRVGFVKSEWPPLEEVVQWIVEAGGIAVLAHPGLYKLTSGKLNRLIEAFIEAGGRAIEVVNKPRHSAEIIGMAQRAERFGLLASMGSDFHRPEHTWRGLGWLAPMPEECHPVWQHFKALVPASS